LTRPTIRRNYRTRHPSRRPIRIQNRPIRLVRSLNPPWNTSKNEIPSRDPASTGPMARPGRVARHVPLRKSSSVAVQGSPRLGHGNMNHMNAGRTIVFDADSEKVFTEIPDGPGTEPRRRGA
jgi:hypothetical protein